MPPPIFFRLVFEVANRRGIHPLKFLELLLQRLEGMVEYPLDTGEVCSRVADFPGSVVKQPNLGPQIVHSLWQALRGITKFVRAAGYRMGAVYRLLNAYRMIVQYRLESEAAKVQLNPEDLRLCCEELAVDLNVRRQSIVTPDDLAQLTERLVGLTYWPVATRSLLTCDRNQGIYRFEHPSYFDFFVASRLLRDPAVLDRIQMNTEIKRFLCEGMALQWESNHASALHPRMVDLSGVGRVFKSAIVALRSAQKSVPAVPEPRFYDAVRRPEVRACLHLLESRAAHAHTPDAVVPLMRHFGTCEGRSVLFDHATRLMWEQSGSQSELERPMAFQYVRYLNEIRFAGLAEWRLPTIEEAAVTGTAGRLWIASHLHVVRSRTVANLVYRHDCGRYSIPRGFRQGAFEQVVEHATAAAGSRVVTSAFGGCFTRAVCSIEPEE